MPASILIVDDNRSNLTAIEAVLSPLGQRLVLVASGDEALKHLLTDEFAVVLLDVVMPGVTGFDVAAMMRSRERTRNVPIIFLTALESERSQMLKGYLHGAADYLVKPFEPDVLCAKVSVFVELYRARETARQLVRQEEQRAQTEREKRHLHTLLMQAPVAVGVVSGREHRFELANERFCRLVNRSEMQGRTLAEVFPELARPPLTSLLEEVYAKGERYSASAFSVLFDRMGDGQPVQSYFDFNIEPMRDDDGRVHALMGMGIDVTDHVNARRARDEFLSIASHELKTPLTTLKLQADGINRALAKGEHEPERLQPKIDIIRRQLGRLDTLIDELLDVSRIAAGKLPMTLEELDLAALTREVVQRFGDQLASAGCATTLQAPAPVLGQWDRMRLDQVITNLITNAMKYGKRAPIEITVDKVGARARLVVTDHGIGIAPEHHQRIFDRFERAASEKSFGGLGLGLWIVRSVVAALGGSVRVDSKVGEGATFTVELPTSGAAQP